MTRLFTDTSANLSAEAIEKYDLNLLHFSYTINGVEVEQDARKDFDGKAFYDAMRNGAVVSTAMIGLGSFLDAFRAVLEAGDDVLYLSMSGGISGTCHAATLAARELRTEYPERQIVVIDTYAASLGEGLLVLEAAEMLERGAPLTEVAEKIAEQRNRMCQYFTVDDLEYLKRGGRIGRVASVVGTAFKIKPLLTGNAEGKIVMCGKSRGRKQSLVALADYYDKRVVDRSATIGIADADAADGAAFLLEELRSRGFTGECVTACYEPVTGSHVGPGTVALFFPGDQK